MEIESTCRNGAWFSLLYIFVLFYYKNVQVLTALLKRCELAVKRITH